MRKATSETNEVDQPSLSFQVDTGPKANEVDSSIKVMIQPLRLFCDLNFFMNIMEFHNALRVFKFQHERVLLSINGIEDIKARLVSKIEYVLSSHKRLMWDMKLSNIVLTFHCKGPSSEIYKMILESDALSLASKCEIASPLLDIEHQTFVIKNILDSAPRNSSYGGFRLQDLYDYFEIKLSDCQVKILTPHGLQQVNVLEKLSISSTMMLCIIQDEALLKNFEVCMIMSPLIAHFSSCIYSSIMALVATVNGANLTFDSEGLPMDNSLNLEPKGPSNTKAFCFSICASIKSASFLFDLENDVDGSCTLMLTLEESELRLDQMDFMESWFYAKGLRIITCSAECERYNHTLCISRTVLSIHSVDHHGMKVKPSIENGKRESRFFDGCFSLHYRFHRSFDIKSYTCTVCINDAEFNCYPHIIGLLVGFFNNIFDQSIPSCDQCQSFNSNNSVPWSGFDFERFGFSNFFEIDSPGCSHIPLDQFPFVTIYNFGSLVNLESALIRAIAEWREVFNLRKDKIVSPNSGVKKGISSCYHLPLKSQCSEDACSNLKRSDVIDLFVTDLYVRNIKIHFHDSSSIIGTLSVPTAKCSISFHGDCLDILCSSEGINLSSSWWNHSIGDFLWGPSLPDLSPILNMRVRKGHKQSLGSLFEICLGVQHVSCILPPEFLAVIIGYFSMPEWKCNTTKPPLKETNEYMDSENDCNICFKFEVLDSILFAPVEGFKYQFIKLDVKQLYGSFVQENDSGMALQGIPIECRVPATKMPNKTNCLNVFGRDLSLLLLVIKDDGSLFDQDVANKFLSLIAPINADVWLRIPSENDTSFGVSSSPTCVMISVNSCQAFAEGGYVFVGYEALICVIDQFSSVGKESNCFESDILQFFQSKKLLRKNSVFQQNSLSVTFIEINCFVNYFSINLNHYRGDSITTDLVAKAEMQFVFSASLENDEPQCLNISFSSITLFYSSKSENSLKLVEFLSSGSISTVLLMNYLTLEKSEHEFHVSVPSLNIWLYLFEWNKLVNLLNSYFEQSKTLIGDRSPGMSSLSPENGMQTAISVQAKSKNFGVDIHVPLQDCGNTFERGGKSKFHTVESFSDQHDSSDGKNYNFVTVSLRSRFCELLFTSNIARFSSKLEKVNGTIDVCGNKGDDACHLFQLFQADVQAELCRNQIDHIRVKIDVQDSLYVRLSHTVLNYWKIACFDIPEGDSSLFAFRGIDVEILARRISVLLIDRMLSISGPLLEILSSNVLLHAIKTEDQMQASVASDILVNYNNIHKASWEPFVEPWKFQINVNRVQEKSVLLANEMMTEIHFKSMQELNFNITESLVEALYRTIEMIKDAWSTNKIGFLSENQDFINSRVSDNIFTGKYAPYILQNLTSLPLGFHVFEGPLSVDAQEKCVLKDGTFVKPGSSFPIFIKEAPEEQLYCYSCSHSSVKQFCGVVHHYISIQLEGTCSPSGPISVDLVGLRYFEVDFSKSSNKLAVDNSEHAIKGYASIEENKTDSNIGFVVPVVVDVSIQHNIKLIRLYSTVILCNATSVPFEVRFDIPLGLSPKVLDPIYPGQEFPLPVHLAKAGRIRWRPLGNTYLWSEAFNILNILSHDTKMGFIRPFVSYPSNPSCDLFRCCVSVQDICLDSNTSFKKCSSSYTSISGQQSLRSNEELLYTHDKANGYFIHLVTLCSPFIVKNYLPEAVSLTIESGGIIHDASLSEVETSFFHVDSSHDLSVVFHIHGYEPTNTKFPRSEAFGTIAKFSGTKFSVSEAITFYSNFNDGLIYVTVEKSMNANSGARELCLFVPFLLYNFTGFSLVVSNPMSEMKGHGCVVPSYYNLDDNDLLMRRKDGLGLLSSNQDKCTTHYCKNLKNFSSEDCVVSGRKNVNLDSLEILSNPFSSVAISKIFNQHSGCEDVDVSKSSMNTFENSMCSSSCSNMQGCDFHQRDYKNYKAAMYSPTSNSSSSTTAVTVSLYSSEGLLENIPIRLWSSPFFLVAPSGSTTVLVPRSSTNGAFVISVTASAITGPFSGRTKAVTFQPRYVISNTSSKNLCYKQKGTDIVLYLGVGQHSHLHWTDTTRELLISICFDEPGWQWSGCFLPEHLGDTQVKMRNYVSGAVTMVRVEVQNADVSVMDERIIQCPSGNSGTSLILISDDDTGFMPYRIDNFTKERLRIYQHRCESFETTVLPYTTCLYAWDEPCCPHRLTIEVVGERVIGSYALDDIKVHPHAHLSLTSEKPQRTLLVSVHAEGAIKVLSIIDSGYHIHNETRTTLFQPNKKREQDQTHETSIEWKEKILVVFPFIGISLINSYSQELLFASAKDTKIEFIQYLDQQKVFFQISSLQVDNQLHGTPYPVMLSFNRESRSNALVQIRARDDNVLTKNGKTRVGYDCLPNPVFYLDLAKWRSKDISVISFEHITLRVVDFWLQVEQEVILSLFEFFKTIYTRTQTTVLHHMDSTIHPYFSELDFVRELSDYGGVKDIEKLKKSQPHHINVHYDLENSKGSPLLLVTPIGAPWQQIYPPDKRQKKVYIELLDVAPIKLTLSFSSSPWVLRNGVLTSGESLIHRGLMALADVEGVQIHLKHLTISHQLASWESMQGILIRYYTRQLLHETYKVFGSVGLIGNPMGFARRMSIGIKEFLLVPVTSVLQSPAGLLTGMAQGTSSLLSNTIYAISDATTQFSRAVHKGILAFTFDDLAAARIEKQQKGLSSNNEGVINEVFEGLTGLLQSPIKGAEKHGLPGFFSGIALGVTGLVAKPAASLFEVTGTTAQSIRSRSKHHNMGTLGFRVRLPRPLSRDYPIRPYSWEEAVGTSVLAEFVGNSDPNILVMCKVLKEGGKFVVISEKLILAVSCPSLINLGKSNFHGIPANPQWVTEAELKMDSVIYADIDEEVLQIVGTISDTLLTHKQQQKKNSGGLARKKLNPSLNSLPFFHANLEFISKKDAEEFLEVLLSTLKKEKEQGWGHVHLLRQNNHQTTWKAS